MRISLSLFFTCTVSNFFFYCLCSSIYKKYSNPTLLYTNWNESSRSQPIQVVYAEDTKTIFVYDGEVSLHLFSKINDSYRYNSTIAIDNINDSVSLMAVSRNGDQILWRK